VTTCIAGFAATRIVVYVSHTCMTLLYCHTLVLTHILLYIFCDYLHCHTNTTLHYTNRKMFVTTAVAVGLIFWASVVFGIQALTSIKSLDTIFPGLAEYTVKHPLLGQILTTYLPVIALLLLIQNLYFIFKALAKRIEGYKTESEVERAVMGRYFYYQVQNLHRILLLLTEFLFYVVSNEGLC
jgi:Calcium-dependent channel, 7TM region, putative phosphate